MARDGPEPRYSYRRMERMSAETTSNMLQLARGNAPRCLSERRTDGEVMAKLVGRGIYTEEEAEQVRVWRSRQKARDHQWKWFRGGQYDGEISWHTTFNEWREAQGIQDRNLVTKGPFSNEVNYD